jgi:hypothetical protein
MTKIAETYFRLDIRLAKKDQEAFRAFFQQKAEAYADGLFHQKPEFAIYVEDGSTKTWIVVGGSLYAAIAGYGSFRSGIDYAVQDARTFSERVFGDVRNSGISDDRIRRLERRLGVPGKLQKLMQRVDRLEHQGRDLSRDEYKDEVRAIRERMLRILQEIDSEKDAALVLENIPTAIRADIPNRVPAPPVISHPRVALRPEEEHHLSAQPRALSSYVPVTKESSFNLDDPLFVLEPTRNGFHLRPAKR